MRTRALSILGDPGGHLDARAMRWAERKNMRLKIAIPGAKRVGSFIIQMILGICLAARSRAAEETLRADDPLIDANSPQLWALATDAIHSSSRNAGLERLRWGPATKANIEYVKKDLAEGPWGITNREDVLRSFKFTQTEGYTKTFLEMGAYLEKTSEDERRAFIAGYKDDPDVMNQIEIVTNHYHLLKGKGLLAWDLARCIALCRRAYTAGYLNREEAWAMIMPVARRMQSVFDSWEDMGNNYLLGRRFWSKTAADKGNPILEKQFKKLLEDQNSVWHTVPWKLDLTATAQPAVGGYGREDAAKPQR